MKYFYKNLRFNLTLFLSLFLACCGEGTPGRYVILPPQAPQEWTSLLGEPHWRLEWLDSSGKRILDLMPGESAEIELPVTWTNPVTAWPYWPAHNLIPGLFKPAGALFPFDVRGSGGRLPLTWKSGPDTVFYWELALAAADTEGVKIPSNFDWLRFRELFETGILSEDPWLVDWRSVAEKTIESSFDRRRLIPAPVESIAIPVPSGAWYGTSPFAEALFSPEGETPVFPLRAGLNVWVSCEGILRCIGKTWVFTAWE